MQEEAAECWSTWRLSLKSSDSVYLNCMVLMNCETLGVPNPVVRS